MCWSKRVENAQTRNGQCIWWRPPRFTSTPSVSFLSPAMRCFQITCISRFNKAFDYNTTSAPQLKQRFQRNGSDVMSRQPMETLILDKWLYQDPIKYLTSLAKDILFYFIHVLFYVILFYLILFYLIYSFFFTGVLLG